MGLINKLGNIGKNGLVAGALSLAVLVSPAYSQRVPKEPANYMRSGIKEEIERDNVGVEAKRKAEFLEYDAKEEAEAKKYDAEMDKRLSMATKTNKELEGLLGFEKYKSLVGEEKVREAGERIKVCEQLWYQNPVGARKLILSFYEEGLSQKLFTGMNQFNVGILKIVKTSEEDLDREEKIWSGMSDEAIKKYRRISAERKVVALFKDKQKLKETYGCLFPGLDFDELYNPNSKKNYDGELFFMWAHARSVNRVDRYNEKLTDEKRDENRFVDYLFRSIKLHPEVKK
jgi:hypothetical protein